jgi:hypothetical protein
MNLHAIVRGAIQTINPDTITTLLRSTGYTTDAASKQIPTYDTLSGPAQIQACSGKDIERINFLALQGIFRTVYLYGNWMGIVRADKKGGDVLKFPQVPGATVQDWKIVNVKETWPDWCSVIVQLQTSTVTP